MNLSRLDAEIKLNKLKIFLINHLGLLAFCIQQNDYLVVE